MTASLKRSTTTAASTTTFTSPFYGYAVTLAAGWSATPATVTWDGKGAAGSDEQTVTDAEMAEASLLDRLGGLSRLPEALFEVSESGP